MHTFLKKKTRNVPCANLTRYSTQYANIDGVPGVLIEAFCFCLSTNALRSLPLLRSAPSRHPLSRQPTFPSCCDAKNTLTAPHQENNQPLTSVHMHITSKIRSCKTAMKSKLFPIQISRNRTSGKKRRGRSFLCVTSHGRSALPRLHPCARASSQ